MTTNIKFPFFLEFSGASVLFSVAARRTSPIRSEHFEPMHYILNGIVIFHLSPHLSVLLTPRIHQFPSYHCLIVVLKVALKRQSINQIPVAMAHVNVNPKHNVISLIIPHVIIQSKPYEIIKTRIATIKSTTSLLF